MAREMSATSRKHGKRYRLYNVKDIRTVNANVTDDKMDLQDECPIVYNMAYFDHCLTTM